MHTYSLLMKRIVNLFVLLLLLASCETIDVYEKIRPFPEQRWSSNNTLSFTFDIKDSSALYNIFVVVRHTDAYHFNNMWLGVTTVAPGDAPNTQKVKLKLGDDNNGWLGVAVNDIIEHRVLLTRYPVKLKPGRYTFTLQQIMREDPLENMLHAGIRVEKAK